MNALERCAHPNIVALLEARVKYRERPVMIEELMKCTLEEYFERRKSIFTGNAYRAPLHMVLSFLPDSSCFSVGLECGRHMLNLAHCGWNAGKHVVP